MNLMIEEDILSHYSQILQVENEQKFMDLRKDVLKKEQDDFQKSVEENIKKFQEMRQNELIKIQNDKSIQCKPDRTTVQLIEKERENCRLLKLEYEKLKGSIEQTNKKNKTEQNRLKEKYESLLKENIELKRMVAMYEELKLRK
jgi:hypothetical protein